MTDTLTQVTPAVVLRRAAAVLQRHGLAKGRLHTWRGQQCMGYAIVDTLARMGIGYGDPVARKTFFAVGNRVGPLVSFRSVTGMRAIVLFNDRPETTLELAVKELEAAAADWEAEQ